MSSPVYADNVALVTLNGVYAHDIINADMDTTSNY
jgi:hypothetical protein